MTDFKEGCCQVAAAQKRQNRPWQGTSLKDCW